jgi:hypothetical protein
MHFPYDDLALESRLKDLQIALLRSGGKRRRMPSQEEQTVQDFGRDLFDALLSGEVRSRYDVSLREAAQQGKGLRLKLRIESPKLAALPWEFLYDSRQAEYVCLSRNTPIVRYLELPQPPRPLIVTPPLRILGMIAAPHDLPPMDMAREKERIERATQDLRSHSLVELTWIEGQTWRDLQQAMWSGPWHIFHFIGHGGFDHSSDEGFIVLVEEDGRSNRLSATPLGRLLADHPSLRLVLLNSCEGARGGKHDIFSSTAAILVRRGVPAVVAMQYEITDQAAIEFAQAFYGALTYGKPVDEALVEARKAISFAVSNTVEWGTPVLHMRSPDGILFDIQRGTLKPQPPLPEPEPRKASIAHRWLRSLPLPAWAGLLVLLLVLGVVAVWQFCRGSAHLEPTGTVSVAIESTATPMLTVTPTTAPTPTSTPLNCPPVPAVSAPFEEAWGSSPEIGCPADPAIIGIIADEDFEGGKMFWSEHGEDFWDIEKDSDRAPILVLFGDRTWQLVEHPNWKEGDPEFTCPDANTPSECPPTPKRGFGKVWCGIPELRDKLGKVEKCEEGHTGSMQQFESGFMVQASSGEIYIFYCDGADYGHYDSR